MDSETRAAFSSVNDRFDKVDARFDKVDARFVEVDARFVEVDARFDEVDARLDKVDARFVEVDARFDEVDARLDTLTEQMSRAATLISALAEGQDELRHVVQDMGKRIDGYTEAVLRGLTEGVSRDSAIERRVDALEDRVTRLEHGTSGPR